MIDRYLYPVLKQRLREVSAVVLLGPRQVGKTTLAKRLAEERSPTLYLDLESPSDLAKLAEPELYLQAKLDQLVILDEIHRTPHLFNVLRGLIDEARRQDRRAGLYLLLGSASLELLRQSGESLAGRVSFLELGPLNLLEVAAIPGGQEHKRVFDLVKDFGTSESPKSTRSSTTHWCPGRLGHPAFRHNIASSLRLHTGLPYDWTPRSDAPLGSPLAPSARRVSRVASRLPGTTRLRFALHGGQRLWLRGGFPDSFLASGESQSLRWRQDFIRTYLERDIPQFGPRIPSETLRRFWTMLAHQQAAPFNASQLARSLGVDSKTVSRYLDLLVDLLLVRRLPVWRANVGKRLVKRPKAYVRDSGLVHALLGIREMDALLSHPVVGASWEGFVIEQLLLGHDNPLEGYYYRTAGGAEVDLLMHFADGALWAVEIKRSLSPKPTRGFHEACRDLQPERRCVVYPGTESYPLGEEVEVCPLMEMARSIHEKAAGS